MDAMVEAMKPYIGMLFAIWFISEVITAMFRLHRKKSYQDRRMANDTEHAKVTRAMRYDVFTATASTASVAAEAARMA